jgi:hypothetical protein
MNEAWRRKQYLSIYLSTPCRNSNEPHMHAIRRDSTESEQSTL